MSEKPINFPPNAIVQIDYPDRDPVFCTIARIIDDENSDGPDAKIILLQPFGTHQLQKRIPWKARICPTNEYLLEASPSKILFPDIVVTMTITNYHGHLRQNL